MSSSGPSGPLVVFFFDEGKDDPNSTNCEPPSARLRPMMAKH